MNVVTMSSARSETPATGPAPLEGLRVVDFTQVMMGPSATQTLGDMGADVIKVERAGAGDLSRLVVPADEGMPGNAIFCSLNRNKRSLSINLRSDEGKAVVQKLIASADVVVNNFRPGVMSRLGLDYETLSAANPRLIYAEGTGFGSSGPYEHKGGQDVLAQAMSGVMARKSDPKTPTTIYATTLCDYTAGMHMVQAILAALLQREKTGRGQRVEVSLYDSMLAMQMQEAAAWLNQGEDLNWGAMPLTGVFETADGALVLVGAFKENPLRDICAALEIEDLSPTYPDLESQRRHRETIQTRFREAFKTNTTAHWLARLEEQDLLCAPVKTLAEALDDEQTAVNGMVVDCPLPGGRSMRVLGQPVHMSGAPLAIRQAPPGLGEHSAQILAELGYEPAEIARLKDGGVIE